MEIEVLKRLKKLQKLTNEELAKKSGVPVGTLNKIFSGATGAPRHETVIAIAEALNYRPYEADVSNLEALREALSYDVSRKYTVEDYYNLPRDVRAELIDGSFYFMEAPNTNHQTLLGELYFLLKAYIKRKEGTCKVFIAPFDVKLDQDSMTMVQPDLMVICNRDKVSQTRCEGAPDLVMEISSPSSSRLDYIKKLNKYLDAGVREYWIVDPDKERVTIYQFQVEDNPQIYSFSDQIPVGIYEDLIIDFKEVAAERI
jgi:Uma2 family endonuclease